MATNWQDVNTMTTSWTEIPKPVAVVGSSIVAGEVIGMLSAITYSDESSFSSDIWTYIPKAD